LITEYYNYYTLKLNNHEITKKFFSIKQKAILGLKIYHETGKWDFNHLKKGSSLIIKNPYFLNYLNELNEYLSKITKLKASTKHRYEVEFKKIFIFLESKNQKDFSQLTIQFVEEYMTQMHKSNPNSMDFVIRGTEFVINYLYNQGLISINPDIDLSILNPQKSNTILITTFTKQEIISLLENIDRKTVMGKRDYAILVLAITTGLRKADIASLQLEDINWVDKSIRKIQCKTTVETKIPLINNAVNALADYILNGRPKLNYKQIFLTVRPPIRPLLSGSLNNVLKYNFIRAGVNNKFIARFHCLRRTNLTILSQDDNPIDLVALCAGHSDLSSVDRYISVSPTMVECCLPLKGIEPKGWEDSNV
jgi:site-specific recombinase XerD